MKSIYADLHVHIGRTLTGKPVKITGAKSLNLSNIIHYAREIKGIDLIGVIDCHVPEVIAEIEQEIKQDEAYEHPDGGVVFSSVTLLLGSEIEIYDEYCKGPIHVLVFLPTIEKMKQFSKWLSSRMTNVHLSSQRLYESGRALQQIIKNLDGLFIPAHVFTPFKSLYGKGVHATLTEVFEPDMIDAIELGLSSNTEMADQLSELHNYPYLSNSDAHSLEKIAREYQEIVMKEPTFREFERALKDDGDRKIVKNYGLSPKLGKYYRTTCQHCFTKREVHTSTCPNCQQSKWVQGVFERLQQLKDTEEKKERPLYIEQIPLECFPGIGPKTLEKLRKAFRFDRRILHDTSYEQLLRIIPERIATLMMEARSGNLAVAAGGGGKYGKIQK